MEERRGREMSKVDCYCRSKGDVWCDYVAMENGDDGSCTQIYDTLNCIDDTRCEFTEEIYDRQFKFVDHNIIGHSTLLCTNTHHLSVL